MFERLFVSLFCLLPLSLVPLLFLSLLPVLFPELQPSAPAKWGVVLRGDTQPSHTPGQHPFHGLSRQQRGRSSGECFFSHVVSTTISSCAGVLPTTSKRVWYWSSIQRHVCKRSEIRLCLRRCSEARRSSGRETCWRSEKMWRNLYRRLKTSSLQVWFANLLWWFSSASFASWDIGENISSWCSVNIASTLFSNVRILAFKLESGTWFAQSNAIVRSSLTACSQCSKAISRSPRWNCSACACWALSSRRLRILPTRTGFCTEVDLVGCNTMSLWSGRRCRFQETSPSWSLLLVDMVHRHWVQK